MSINILSFEEDEKLTKIANATVVIYSATLDKYMILVKKMHDDMLDKFF